MSADPFARQSRVFECILGSVAGIIGAALLLFGGFGAYRVLRINPTFASTSIFGIAAAIGLLLIAEASSSSLAQSELVLAVKPSPFPTRAAGLQRNSKSPQVVRMRYRVQMRARLTAWRLKVAPATTREV